MIVSLAQDRIREVAKAAAREQAWTDGRGVRGVPARREGEQPTGACWDLTAVVEAIDRADVLEWRGSDLTVRVRGDWPRVFTLSRGDDREGLADVVGSSDLDWLLQLAGEVEQAHLRSGQAGTGGGLPWVVACEDVALTSESGRLPAAADEVLEQGRAVPGRLAWEVDGPDGTPLYRGWDLELAEELYHAAPAGAHLLPAPCVPGGDQAQAACPAAAGRLADAGVVTAGVLAGAVTVLISLLLAGLAWLPAPEEPGTRTERVCYSTGWAADVTTSADGSLTASGEFPCHYTGGA